MTGLDDSTLLEHLKRAAGTAGIAVGEFVLPSNRYVMVNGLRLHYLDWGNSAASPVLFLHGGGLTSHTWDLVCLALRAGHHCVALDLRGHGDSEWSADLAYRLADLADDVERLTAELGFSRFSLVGMSLGGMAAMAFAGRRPECLTSLTIIDVGTRIHMDSARRIRRFMTEVTIFESIDDVIERAMAFNPRRDRRLLRHSLMHNLRRLPDGRWAWKHDNRHRQEERYLADLRAQVEELADRLHLVKCPVLVVRGEQSDVLPMKDARELAGSFEHGRVAEIPGAGHTVQGDNPAALVRVLSEFLETDGT